VLSITHLQPYRSDPTQERTDLEPLRGNPEEFEVEEIVDQHRERHRKKYRLMYQCGWKGYGVTDKWIPESDLRNTKEVLDAWKLKQKGPNSGE
jgi:predicted aminopeptidase